MNDDRYRIQIDRDRDGNPDEVIDTDPASGGMTEEPEPVQLPPRLVRTHPTDVGTDRSHEPFESDDRRDPPVFLFAFAVVAVVILAAVVAVIASRLVGAADVGDDAATVIGMLVGVACAVGAFLAIARLTRMLGLLASAAHQPDSPRQPILATAHVDVAFRDGLAAALGVPDQEHGSVMLDLVSTGSGSEVALRVLDADGQVISETPFDDRAAAFAFAERTYGVRHSDWTELR